MIVRLEELSYSYAGNNIINVSGQCAIYADDGTTLLHKKGVSTRQNLANNKVDANGDPAWKVSATGALSSQMVEIVTAYQAIMQAVQSAWPTAQTPEEALLQLKTDVEASVTSALGG